MLGCIIGRAHLSLKRWADAERAFRAALRTDPDLPLAHLGLAATFLGTDRLEQAAEEALNAIGLRYDSPGAHYLLGVALARLGRIERAIQAFESCLAMWPRSPAAHAWLASIHEQATGDLARASEHRRLAAEIGSAVSQ